MPRPRNPNPTVRLTIRVPQETLSRLNALFWDTAHNKPHYGAISKYINHLIDQSFKERDRDLSHQPKERENS